MKYLLLFFTLYGIQFQGIAQDSGENKVVKYFEDLKSIGPGIENTLFTAQLKYMATPFRTTFNAQGGMLNVGINFARFFSKKITFGFTVDLKAMPGYSRANLSNQFVNDFNASYISTYETSIDSINAQLVQSAIADCTPSNCNYLRGTSIFNYGLMLSLFPNKYGGILLEAKYGRTGFHLRNVFGSENVRVGGYDKYPIGIKHWTYEITFKPVAFFKKAYKPNIFVISFFYQRLNLRTAAFDQTKLEDMVSSSFMTTYGMDHRFGFKLGFAFY
jgi:hypothetical protein